MRIAAIIILVILLPGCYNALYYYDKVAVAINVEGRPDPSAPVQVSIGAKERTVVVAPGLCDIKQQNGNTGDAVSMMSSFLITKGQQTDQSGQDSNPFSKTVIKAAFLTGEAAKFVPTSKPGETTTTVADDPCSTKPEEKAIRALTAGAAIGTSETMAEALRQGTPGSSDEAPVTKAEAELAQATASAAAKALLPKPRLSGQQGVQALPQTPPPAERKDRPGTPIDNAAAAARALTPGQ